MAASKSPVTTQLPRGPFSRMSRSFPADTCGTIVAHYIAYNFLWIEGVGRGKEVELIDFRGRFQVVMSYNGTSMIFSCAPR